MGLRQGHTLPVVDVPEGAVVGSELADDGVLRDETACECIEAVSRFMVEEEVQVVPNLQPETQEERVDERIYHLDAARGEVLGR